jgi:hypothetical protein
MISVGKSRGKRSLGRHRYKREVNANMDHREDGVGWTGLICLMVGTSGRLL